MSTIVVCDICMKPISSTNGKVNSYHISSQGANPKRFVLSQKDPINPEFRYDICEMCAKTLHQVIKNAHIKYKDGKLL